MHKKPIYRRIVLSDPIDEYKWFNSLRLFNDKSFGYIEFEFLNEWSVCLIEWDDNWLELFNVGIWNSRWLLDGQ